VRFDTQRVQFSEAPWRREWARWLHQPEGSTVAGFTLIGDYKTRNLIKKEEGEEVRGQWRGEGGGGLESKVETEPTFHSSFSKCPSRNGSIKSFRTTPLLVLRPFSSRNIMTPATQTWRPSRSEKEEEEEVTRTGSIALHSYK
jgi:hypothetical protein